MEEMAFAPSSGHAAASMSTEPVSILDNYSGVMEHRSQAYNSRSSMTASDRPDMEQLSRSPSDAMDKMLYQRNTTEVAVKIEDFQIINIIGKGTFGKVSYLDCV